ncbi:MAG: response regulator [Candidatus Omnitrophica bacterium]|nr:response regulator [Candidatus Omnitrophota bacterium]
MNKKKIKLLIVDDEKDICKFIKLLFKREGFLVYSAFSSAAAIRILKKEQPQIALLDIYLKRGESGLDTLKQIRALAPACKCIMVTWDKAVNKIKETKAQGAIFYLIKPLTIDRLLKVVNRVVKNIKQKG